MKRTVTFIWSALLISCAPSMQQRYKQAYLDEFKLVYFKSCLKNGFDNDQINYLNQTDKSGMTEPILGTNVYGIIDNHSRLTANKAHKQSSIEAGIPVEAQGIHLYAECLDAYTSKWLDSMARAEHKKQQRISKRIQNPRD